MTIDRTIEKLELVAEKMKVVENKKSYWTMEEHEQIAKWLEELKEYQKIGTVAECRKIKEKQESMEVQDKKISHFPYSTLVQNVYGKCPVCNSIQSEDNYCANCGQKLDFSIEKNTEIKY